MTKYYLERDIIAKRYPIHDFNQEDLKAKLKEGADLFNKLINEENKQVYVHCTAGMGRAPAVCLVYLCLYKGMDPDYADTYVK